MFYYLYGEVSVIDQSSLVVDCNGVGYLVNTSYHTISNTHNGTQAKIYTYVVVREDAFDIYGFLSTDELDCFKMLINVSGVGPKAAVAVLSELPPERLAPCIASGDYKTITRAQGIGPKTAQRIVLELRDKMKHKTMAPRSDQSESVSFMDFEENNKYSEAKNALMVLGYSQAQAVAVLKELDVDTLSIEEIIRRSLRQLMK